MNAIGAGLAMLSALGAGLGICIATGKAVEAIAKNPESANKINNVLLLGCAMAESVAVYAFIIALVLAAK